MDRRRDMEDPEPHHDWSEPDRHECRRCRDTGIITPRGYYAGPPEACACVLDEPETSSRVRVEAPGVWVLEKLVDGEVMDDWEWDHEPTPEQIRAALDGKPHAEVFGEQASAVLEPHRETLTRLTDRTTWGGDAIAQVPEDWP